MSPRFENKRKLRRSWSKGDFSPIGAALLFLLGMLMGVSLSAQELEELQLDSGLRYDNSDYGDDKNRFQGSLELDVNVRLIQSLRLKSFSSTGPKYDSTWTTLSDFTNSSKEEVQFFVRQLYLENWWGRHRVQIGFIAPIKNLVSPTGLNKNGWIDGMRVEHFSRFGTAEVVAGSISDLENPNVFTRERDLNFFEIEFSQPPERKMAFELSYEHFKDDNYARGEVKRKLDFGHQREMELLGEGVYNIDARGGAFSVSSKFDLLMLFTGRNEKLLEIAMYYTYMSEEIGLRGELADEFTEFGHSLTFKFKGRLSREYHLDWFGRFIAAEVPRFTFGVKHSLQI